MDVQARIADACWRTALPAHRRATVALLALLALAGCSSTRGVALRETPKNALLDRLDFLSKSGPKPTGRTNLLLRRFDLQEEWKHDPNDALVKLQAIIARDPSPDKIASYGELAYLAGAQVEPKDRQAALELYASAVMHAYQYLFDPRLRSGTNPYDPQFRETCELYNGALESALRIEKKDGGLKPGSMHSVQVAGQTWDVTLVSRAKGWHAEDIARFEFVADYQVKGLQNHYRNYGLGVPLIAVRQDHKNVDPTEKFYPPGLSFPVTALLRTLPDELPSGVLPTSVGTMAGVHHRAVIELFDPLETPQVACGARPLPLESDLTTPLAYFLDNPDFNDNSLSYTGLINPASAKKLSGVYMLEPYDPHKIPVLFVHGLWSSPITWMEMFNDLRSQPEIRDRYQFWFYFYPTGQPFWISARMLRDELANLRQTVDPQMRSPALDQMVLVGHSMGGLVSRLQTVDSGDAYWNLVANEPLDQIKTDPKVRDVLAETYYFHPNMSIRRVVTIATPFRGSKLSNDTTRWLSHELIHLPGRTVGGEEKLLRDNPGVFRPNGPLEVSTSIDALSPESAILPVMVASKRPPWIKHHNIVGMIPQRGVWGEVAGKGDGVVEFKSAHLDDVDSEIVVPADHSTIHTHPRAVLEVRRILLEHLADLDGHPELPAPVLTGPGGPGPMIGGPAGIGQPNPGASGPNDTQQIPAMPGPVPNKIFLPPPLVTSPIVQPPR